MIGQHAYLIMVHNQPEHLKKLLCVLDHERNDIFIHVDKKADIDINSLFDVCQKSKVYFTNSINVYWGGWTQIEAELILLEEATAKGKYQYYHLLTGGDFPLRKQSEILNFFDINDGKNFISYDDVNSDFFDRIKYYYPLQHHQRNIFFKKIRKLLVICQRTLGVDRTKKYPQTKKYGMGSAYFDITDDVARYIVSKKNEIQKEYRYTFCADEVFLQSQILNSKLYRNLEIYKSNESNPYIQNIYMDVVRAVDWTRGRPYVWQAEDFNVLMESSCLFARKFDYTKSPKIVDMIFEKIRE